MQTAAILPQLATAAAPARTIGSDSRAFAPAMEQASSAIGQKGQRASDSGSDLAGAVNAQANNSGQTQIQTANPHVAVAGTPEAGDQQPGVTAQPHPWSEQQPGKGQRPTEPIATAFRQKPETDLTALALAISSDVARREPDLSNFSERTLLNADHNTWQKNPAATLSSISSHLTQAVTAREQSTAITTPAGLSNVMSGISIQPAALQESVDAARDKIIPLYDAEPGDEPSSPQLLRQLADTAMQRNEVPSVMASAAETLSPVIDDLTLPLPARSLPAAAQQTAATTVTANATETLSPVIDDLTLPLPARSLPAAAQQTAATTVTANATETLSPVIDDLTLPLPARSLPAAAQQTAATTVTANAAETLSPVIDDLTLPLPARSLPAAAQQTAATTVTANAAETLSPVIDDLTLPLPARSLPAAAQQTAATTVTANAAETLSPVIDDLTLPLPARSLPAAAQQTAATTETANAAETLSPVIDDLTLPLPARSLPAGGALPTGELQTSQSRSPSTRPGLLSEQQRQQPEILQSVIARSSANNSESLSSSKTSRPRIDDPRFASLLAPQQTPSLRQQTGENPSLMAVPAPAPSPIGPTESPAEGKLTATTSTPSADQAFDNSLLTMSQGNSDITGTEFSHPADRQNPSAVASSLQPGPAATPTSAGDSLLLRDGSQLPASRVITQTIEHLSVHARGDSSVVTVKLHPEELGELQLRLVMEGDQLRVQLHTQHQQVQDVLERNFPRLRDALQDQGLTIEDFQVSLDNGQNPQRDFGASSDRQWQGQGFQQVTSDEPENVPTVIAAQALSGRNASGSLSLRV